MRGGSGADGAIEEVLLDLPDAGMEGEETPLHVLALRSDGSHAAASTAAGRKYAYWDDGLAAAEVRDRRRVDVAKAPTTTEDA